MVFDDNEYGQFEIVLVDDGTMDTVIRVCPLDNYTFYKTGDQEFRFTLDNEDGFYRDDAGCMTDEGLKDLAEQALEGYIEQYLID